MDTLSFERKLSNSRSSQRKLHPPLADPSEIQIKPRARVARARNESFSDTDTPVLRQSYSTGADPSPAVDLHDIDYVIAKVELPGQPATQPRLSPSPETLKLAAATLRHVRAKLLPFKSKFPTFVGSL